MARFDVFPDPINSTSFLLDVQSDILATMETRVVVPLVPIKKYPYPMHRLNPVFQIDEHEYVMLTQFLSAVSGNVLKSPVSNLAKHADQITAALDMLFQGF